MELVLSYAVARKDTKPIAKELLTRFKTINGVLDADREELKTLFLNSRNQLIAIETLQTGTVNKSVVLCDTSFYQV